MPVAVLVTVTVAPGRTAPVESVIVPVMVPRIVCAVPGAAAMAAVSRTMPTATVRVNLLEIMVPPGYTR
jgi:hypothetical protein